MKTQIKEFLVVFGVMVVLVAFVFILVHFMRVGVADPNISDGNILTGWYSDPNA